MYPTESGERDGGTYQRNKTCVPIMCPPLEAPENGVILSTKEMFHFGDLVSFQCDFGYVMSGTASLLCNSGGVWNGSIPQCQCKCNLCIQLKHFNAHCDL